MLTRPSWNFSFLFWVDRNIGVRHIGHLALGEGPHLLGLLSNDVVRPVDRDCVLNYEFKVVDRVVHRHEKHA